MKLKLTHIVVLLFVISGFAQQKNLTPAEISSFKSEVQATSKKIITLKSTFVQTKHLSFLTKDITSVGTLYLKANNQLKWAYTKPYEYSVIFKNNTMYVNDQGKKNAVDMSKSKHFEKINKLIVGSINGDLFDNKEFATTYQSDKNHIIAKLVPKSKELLKYIKEIHLYFPVNTGYVSSVRMIEPTSDYTQIEFKERKVNEIIEESVFKN
ncbi:MAG: outer membrane lipoprotein carrier protein LolA [Flavobacterium sp.]|nr:outer membrane lipoprotein carrier protein LolA [Candidatus Neoflavobacterium equi]